MPVILAMGNGKYLAMGNIIASYWFSLKPQSAIQYLHCHMSSYAVGFTFVKLFVVIKLTFNGTISQGIGVFSL